MYKLLKRPFFGAYMVKWRSPLTQEQQEEWVEFFTASKSGAAIKGLFAQSRTYEEKATIVLGHPMGKEAKGYYLKRGYTDMLLNNGFNVVVFDLNGFGESTHGSFSYYKDIVAIGENAQRFRPHLPVGYHGISLGGQWATIAFADPKHVYKFAIVESAATSLEEFWTLFPAAYKMLKFLQLLMPRYRKRIHMVERIKEAKKLNSLLLIYSQADKWVPLEMGQRYKTNSPVPTELWVSPSGEHAELMRSINKKAYQDKILAYFNAAIEAQ